MVNKVKNVVEIKPRTVVITFYKTYISIYLNHMERSDRSAAVTHFHLETFLDEIHVGDPIVEDLDELMLDLQPQWNVSV